MSVSVSTHGLRLKRGSHALRAAVELLSSMRFAIALLTVICIASIIGTVLKQHEPFGNYVNQFGPFWAEFFRAAKLDTIYSAWWFLLILVFLVISTSLCIARNTPRIMADLKTYKEDIRAQSLKAFGQRAETVLDESPDVAANRIGQLLVSGGWKVKLQRRVRAAGWSPRERVVRTSSATSPRTAPLFLCASVDCSTVTLSCARRPGSTARASTPAAA